MRTNQQTATPTETRVRKPSGKSNGKPSGEPNRAEANTLGCTTKIWSALRAWAPKGTSKEISKKEWKGAGFLTATTAIALLCTTALNQTSHGAESGKQTQFEEHKPDVYNPYLSDIEYELIKTSRNMVAIGGITTIGKTPTLQKISEEEEAAKKKPEPKKKKRSASISQAATPQAATLQVATPQNATLEDILQANVYNGTEEDEVDLRIETQGRGAAVAMLSNGGAGSKEAAEGSGDGESGQRQDAKQQEGKRKRRIVAPSLILEESSFQSLDMWEKDSLHSGLESFLYACKMLSEYKSRGKNVQTSELVFGPPEHWAEACAAGANYIQKSEGEIQKFFEDNFTPFLVIDKATKTSIGKFTGYHELSIVGDLAPSAEYKYPLYTKPKGCTNSSNCPTRKQINEGAFNGMGLELCWVSNPFDLWKMQIQGSGIIILPNGNFLRISFGGTNNHKSKNVWDYIYRNLPTKEFRHHAINKFLDGNSALANSIINYNPSYTFFNKNNNRFALGGHRSALVPGRSIAVDIKHIPYGMPMWIQTNLPIKSSIDDDSWIKFNRLTIAQDAGAAIKGAVRADIFFGHGDKATYLANHTNFKGSYYMIIPNKVIDGIKPRTNEPAKAAAPAATRATPAAARATTAAPAKAGNKTNRG